MREKYLQKIDVKLRRKKKNNRLFKPKFIQSSSNCRMNMQINNNLLDINMMKRSDLEILFRINKLTPNVINY